MVSAEAPTVVNSAKYDRQLRLWGDSGQVRLEKCHVCLVNASPPGVETLKNLVLPGIGAFTIIDSHEITKRDTGNNFFLEPSDVGKNRGGVCCKNLLDLNPDVRGAAINEKLDLLLENFEFFKQFTVVVVCYPVADATLRKLAELLWTYTIPMVIPRVCGLWCCIRTIVKEHYVIDAHPEGQLFDLRLDQPNHVPGLTDFIESQDLEKMTREEHMHTPYLILLFKFVDLWKKQENSDSGPKNYKEKKRFQELIRTGIRPKATNHAEDEENFDEAIKAVNTAFTPTVVPPRVKHLFDHDSCINITAESNNFWIIVRALKEFVLSEGQGSLPVQGVIPDMTSDSTRYIKLQSLYQEAAKQGASLVLKYAQELLRSVGKAPESISPQEVKTFCKNAAQLDVIKSCSLESEQCSSSSTDLARLAETGGDLDSQSLINIYVLLRAADDFFNQYGYYPGDCENYESDIVNVKTCLSSVLNRIGVSSKFTMPSELVEELVRYGGGELHSMASFIGGVTSHEVIKLITNQYQPLFDVFIYSGVTTMSETIKF